MRGLAADGQQERPGRPEGSVVGFVDVEDLLVERLVRGVPAPGSFQGSPGRDGRAVVQEGGLEVLDRRELDWQGAVSCSNRKVTACDANRSRT